MNVKGQLSIYLLVMIIALIAISSLFIANVSKLNDTKNDLNLKYQSKETKEILTILNSAKKSIIQEPTIGKYILDSDVNLKDHYG